MGPLAARWLVDSWAAISRAYPGGSLTELEGKLRRIVDRVLPMANRNEKSYLVAAAMREARLCRACKPDDPAEWLTSARNAGRLEKAANEMDRRLQVKAKRQILADTLEAGRASGKVFYVVTTHQKPRDEHRGFQGTVCYDARAEKTPAVRRYIRDNGLPSVQELSGPPHWISQALYCRHRFAPLDTQEVLDGTADTVIRDGAHRSLTAGQRYMEYKKRRALARKRAYKDRSRG